MQPQGRTSTAGDTGRGPGHIHLTSPQAGGSTSEGPNPGGAASAEKEPRTHACVCVLVGEGCKFQEKEEGAFWNHRCVIFPETIKPSSSTWGSVQNDGFLLGQATGAQKVPGDVWGPLSGKGLMLHTWTLRGSRSLCTHDHLCSGHVITKACALPLGRGSEHGFIPSVTTDFTHGTVEAMNQ